MGAPQVTGYDAVELLGYGSGGEVWLARDQASGAPVALKQLRSGADLADRDRLRREAAMLAGIDHPHVVRLRSVVADASALVLVLDLAPGGSLARVLATRRRLAAGEVVTLAVPLAQALAAVHAHGLVHGDVTPANVLFSADGRPLLSDLGVSRLLGVAGELPHGTSGYLDPALMAGGRPGPATDVHGLAATCMAAITGSAPYDDHGRRVPVPGDTHPGVRPVLEAALAADPAARPGLEELAVALYDIAQPEPVRFDPVSPTVVDRRTEDDVPVATHRAGPVRPAPPEPLPVAAARAPRGPSTLRRTAAALRATGRGALVAGAVAGAVLLAAVTGITWAAAGRPGEAAALPARPTADPAPARPAEPAPAVTSQPAATVGTPAAPVASGRWAGTLSRLDRERSRAYRTGDPALLRQVYAVDSPALQRDRRVLGRLARSGLRAVGLRLTATRVQPRQRSDRRVRLAVTDVLRPYRLVDAGGTVVERPSGRGQRSWTVVLARDGGRWRVYDVVRG